MGADADAHSSTQSSGNPTEQGKEGLCNPERSKKPQEHAQNHLTWTHGAHKD